MKLIKTDVMGRISASVETDVSLAAMYIADGFVEVAAPYGATHYRAGMFLTQPVAPSAAHEWNDEVFSWVMSLDSTKEQAKATITTARNTEEGNGFMAYGKLFDSDPLAIQRISVAVQAAQVVGEAFTIEWTCADNSVITLDYAQMVSLPFLMAQAANTLHIKARDLKAQITLATTVEEVAAITW